MSFLRRYEIATGLLPFDDMTFSHSMELSNHVIGGGRPTIPLGASVRYWGLF